ncbi:hypothetical protein [Hydrogenophaga sp.]|uniref:hypothetical protein n=1 Tax=Hydrogenophaga sp. TaxID=1904254 RepID=UPI0027207ED0|nr:hypothetical protein [Hydrogenophaga sp.]MDO9131979.1 hypothetical protein [Hydrogenophaga sp.]
MAELKAAEGELKAVIHVTRKETGKVETYEVVGKVNHEEMQALLQPEQKEVTE